MQSSIRTNEEHRMPGNPRDMITVAERRFPVRIRIRVPPGGFGQRHAQITAWLDENCGADGWAMTPSGVRGVLNDAVSIYFADATLASAFVARWCAGYKVETADGAWQASHCLQRSPRRRSSLSDLRRCSDERRSGIVAIGRGALQRAGDLASRRRGQMPSPQPIAAESRPGAANRGSDRVL
jgi:hypothetical protein